MSSCGWLLSLLVCHFPGADQSQAQLPGPDCKILGSAGESAEDPSCGEEDFGSPQAEQGRHFTSLPIYLHISVSLDAVDELTAWIWLTVLAAGSRRGRIWHCLPGQAVDQDCTTNGLCPWQSCWLTPARALWENPLSLQSLPEWSEPAGEWHACTSDSTSCSDDARTERLSSCSTAAGGSTVNKRLIMLSHSFYQFIFLRQYDAKTFVFHLSCKRNEHVFVEFQLLMCFI